MATAPAAGPATRITPATTLNTGARLATPSRNESAWERNSATGARKLKVLGLTPPPQRKAGKIVQGDSPEAKAAELARLLHEEAKVI